MEEIIFEDYLRAMNSKSVEELRDIAVTSMYIAIKYIEMVNDMKVSLKEFKFQENWWKSYT